MLALIPFLDDDLSGVARKWRLAGDRVLQTLRQAPFLKASTRLIRIR